MMASKPKSKGKLPPLTHEEIQHNFSRMQNELQTIASKIGELEGEADEHALVLTTLNEALQADPNRKCFRLIGGVLVERTVKDVVPALQTNKENILKVVSNLVEQYKTKEEDFDTFQKDYNIRRVSQS